MAKSKNAIGKLGVLTIILIFITLILLGGIVALYDTTLISPLIPATASLALGLATALWLWKIWRPITGTQKQWPNFICHTACAAILAASLFYICNYAFADKENINKSRVEIVEKYHKVRHHTKRVSRNRYARGEAYNTYHIKVRLDNGTTHELNVTLNKYHRLHAGDSIDIPIAKGALGAPVIMPI